MRISLAMFGLMMVSVAYAAEEPKKDLFSGWALGLGVLKNSKNAVNDARIENGVVRVEEENRYQSLPVLHAHHYFSSLVTVTRTIEKKNNAGVTVQTVKEEVRKAECSVTPLGSCVGLFIAAGIGTNQLIDVLAIGPLIGFGDPTKETDTRRRDINLGIGIALHFRVKTLADGFSDGEAPPAGETQVRFTRRTMTVPIMFLSTTF